MKYSDIKTVKRFCNELRSPLDWRQVVTELAEDNADFKIDDVRFINADSIDAIQCDELSQDDYVLGCFRDTFLAEILQVPLGFVQNLQANECYEKIGMLVKSGGKLEELQQEYSHLDGYGHHFNFWDGSEKELHIENGVYLVFDAQ